jgi:hypothetical protein
MLEAAMSMSRHPRPNGKPQTAGQDGGWRRKAHKPPKGEPWIWLTSELLRSPAWQAQSLHCCRLINFLMIEHLAHGGMENGALVAPYRQLAKFGLHPRRISAAIAEAVALGLLACERGLRLANGNKPSTYRLTFAPSRDHAPPTNEWKHTTPESIEAWRLETRRRRKAKKQRFKNRDEHPHGGMRSATPVGMRKPYDGSMPIPIVPAQWLGT